MVKGRRLLILLFVPLLLLPFAFSPVSAEEEGQTVTIVGWAVDPHGGPLSEVEVDALLSMLAGEGSLMQLGGTESTSDGSYILQLEVPAGTVEELRVGRKELRLQLVKPGYGLVTLKVPGAQVIGEGERYYVELAEAVLSHIINAAFIIATAGFLLTLVLISFRLLHETIAALVGAMLVIGITHTLGTNDPSFHILSFERAIQFIDFDVIFLLMGMMIFMAVIGRTGVFQRMAFVAYRISKGRAFPLAVLLMVLTGLLSCVLNNVTVILLVVPVTIELALLLDIHPLSLVMPEIFAANIGGAGTLIGDPPNTIIGSFAGLGFLEFVKHMGPLALTMTVALLVMVRYLYRREYQEAASSVSPELLKRLEEDTRITDPGTLKRGALIFGATVVLFFMGDLIHMPPSVAALLGATVLLAWLRPNVHEMLGEVDWTTLVFFMALFIVAGAIQEVGLIGMIADLIERLAGDSMALAIVLLLWISGVASALVANIPFTAAVLPIAAFLTRTIPGAESGVLYWTLAAAACFGGNATVIGSASNVVGAGILERAGYRLSFDRYLRVGGPITLVILLLSTLWILVRY